MFHTSTYFGGLCSRFPRSGARKNVGNSLSSCHYISGGGHSLEEVEQGEEEGENEMAETKVWKKNLMDGQSYGLTSNFVGPVLE